MIKLRSFPFNVIIRIVGEGNYIVVAVNSGLNLVLILTIYNV